MTAALIPRGAQVAVIGAGAAGLAAARAVRDVGYAPTVFEAASECGGTWNYGDITGKSSMYENLRCNLPKEIMQFRNVPFPHSSNSFLGHRQVQQYLVNYAKKFYLRELIKYRTKVLDVTPTGESAWSVTVTNDDSASASAKHVFDAVVIANGHYGTPVLFMPPGAVDFPGTVTHSHTYRNPDPFVNRRVVVLGAGPSGTDIGLELACAGAAEVYLSHRRGAGQTPYGGIVPQVAAISSLTADGSVILEDGTRLPNVDDVLLCTGYAYELPFLNSEAGVRASSDAGCIRGLVEHCVSLRRPTLSVIGLPWRIVPFPLFEDQANFIVAVLSGLVNRKKLYWLHQRELEEAALFTNSNDKNKYTHCLGDRQWEYRRRFAELADFPFPSLSSIEIYNDTSAARKLDPRFYRERAYRVYGDGPGEWQVFENGLDVTGRDDPDPHAASRPFH